MSLVNIRVIEQTALIEINSPPVNALSAQLRAELIAAIIKVPSMAGVSAIVLHCLGSTFICGADIREFDGEPLTPHLPELITLLEACPLPVIALLHGHVLGGGLEVAAACHYRIALDNTNIGLPEVGLGVVPGAGGCQRMMRLVGIENTVKLATSGRAVKVTNQNYRGACDHLLDNKQDLLTTGLAWVKTQIAAQELPAKVTSEQPLQDTGTDINWQALVKSVTRSAKSNPAPLRLLKQLQTDWPLPVVEGECNTRELFLELRQSVAAKALRHAFFVEKKMQAGRSNQPFTIQQVAVIGAGTMGSAIAICFADAGFEVLLLEQSTDALDRGLSRIKGEYNRSCEKGRINAQQCETRISLITGSCDYAALSNADLVIEAAFESLDVKQSIFKALDGVCKENAILATNTSYLDIDVIAQSTSRAGSVVGLHFFSPANIMKLLEIVKADKTDDAVIAQMQQLAKKLRKQAVTVGVCFGFAANRIYTRYGREVQQMLLEGASIDLVDKAMRDFGMAMGPLAVQDLSGIDIGHNARSQYPQPEHDVGYFKVSAAMVKAGRLGRKTGSGFYNYATNEPSIDQEVIDIITQLATELKIPQTTFDVASIQERAILAMISEAMKVIKEGIVSDKEAIDLIWLHGYGFPRAKGGPMFQAAQSGAAELASKMAVLSAAYGEKIWPKLDFGNV
ncbi:MAG: 3-hydroxyacyl-CoA dehydrogenase NAD-binding domain-containing protein [Oceanospirillaceae bacterium]